MRQRLLNLSTILCLTVLGLCAFGPGCLQASAGITVDASLSHRSFARDDAARLTITVSGASRDADIALPEIDNIRLRNQGTSRQFSMVNGTISSSISQNYLVQAEKPGRYTIPAIEVRVGGETYTTRPINFEVTQTRRQLQGYSGTTGQTAGELAFIRISKTGSHYPGEIVPFTIKAYFTQAYRADINSLPTLRGDGVVMAQLQDKPEQTEESVGGRMYHVLTWDTSLSGIKVGEHPISFSLDATLLIPQKRRSLSPFGNSLLDDSFFNDSALDSFFGRNRRKPIVAVSPKVVFTVIPLPSAGQPDNFTGAIGDFDLKVSAKPTEVEIGEPLTLTMEISGTGNFDRVDAPAFPENPDWKTYTPTSDLSNQSIGYSGTKTFEQAVVAKSGRATQIPSLSFSYFDPDQKRYFTKASDPIAIQLKTPATPIARPALQPAVRQQQPPATQVTGASATTGLAPIHLDTGTFHDRIVPPFYNRLWLAICGGCVLVLLLFLVQRIWQANSRKHPERALQRQKKMVLESDLKKIEQAQKAGDGLRFLSLCRSAIQNQLGTLWAIEPAALSLADLKGRLEADSDLLILFRAAEEAAYGGASLTDQKMQDYYLSLKRELEALL